MIDTGPDGPKGPHVFQSFKIKFFSAVDHPAQRPALAMVVAKRDPNAPPPAPTGDPAMDPIVALANIQKRLGAILGLTGSQFDHFRSLNEAGQDAFLAQGDSARNVEVAKALDANPVVADLGNGIVVRKGDGQMAVLMATQLIEARKREADAQLIANATVYKARAADEIGHLPMNDGARIALLVSVDKIENPEVKAEVLKGLKAQSLAVGKAGRIEGVSGGRVKKGEAGEDGKTAASIIALKVRKMADEQKLDYSVAYDKFLDTEEGRTLRADHEAEQREKERQLAE